MNCFTLEREADGTALVVFDVPGRSMNAITMEVIDELETLIDEIANDSGITGVILASGKDSGFCAGADLGTQAQRAGNETSEAELRAGFERAFRLNSMLRKLETAGKPVAIALEGLALGGGFEIALACHYRVAARSPKVKLGLPESTVGLIPGAGGTQRLPRLIGIAKALPLLLEGKPMSAENALAAGAIHEAVDPGQAVEAARAWLRTAPEAVQPWDRKDFQIPGGGPYTPGGGAAMIGASAAVRKRYFGNFPAQENILQCVYEGIQVPIDAALRIESRFFLKTRQSPQAKAMIRTQFQSIQSLRKGALRPAGIAQSSISRGAVIGAGMMGAGIAYVQAAAGIETVLLDVSMEGAEKGKAYSRQLLDKAVAKGGMTRQAADEILARITPAIDFDLIAGCDIVVEAVFEDRELKADVTRRAEARLAPGAIFGSNTSTLPITGLAEAATRPEAFIGIHFFSPVDRMELVEVITGERTTRDTLARTLDYVAQIRKTPIVVNDSRGFYTSRCFGTYTSEGIELLSEGIAPAIIDNVGRATGMPRGPLELIDDVALDLIHKVRKQTRKDMGDAYRPDARDGILAVMVEQHGRFGRKNGKGFYDYPADGSPKSLWPGLGEVAEPKQVHATPALIAEVRTRLLYRQAIEAARCLDEGVITDPRSGDVGAVLGWGFARWTGGPLSLIDMVGVAEFVSACDALAERCGPRFAPPQLLRDLAARRAGIYDAAPAAQAA
jgi:3-hydroxyacyl-CoA dehydrogenase/enoyl-CoA hydratase/3-hydroxybutyryl-CoA epimerase